MFRVKHKPMRYADAKPSAPILSGGWIPLHGMSDGLEPGDMTKFMSIPWQTDYNSCPARSTRRASTTSGRNTATATR